MKRQIGKTNRSSSAAWYNYHQLLVVFAAFAIMALAAYYFIGNILRDRLYSETEDMLASAGENVKANLDEADNVFLGSYYVVESMVRRGASPEDILEYLTDTSRSMMMRIRNQSLLNYYGVYGYINGEFYDGIRMNPDDAYVPQSRPWYQTAMQNSDVAYTTPYKDARTGDIIISVVRPISIQGSMAGVFAMDVNLKWLAEYIGSLSLTADGYGMLLNQDAAIIAHPDDYFVGGQLQDIGGAFGEIAQVLLSGGDVSAFKGKNHDGSQDIIFFRQIFNGWYVGLATPYSQFYRDLNSAAKILAILGLGLSLILCFILLRLSAARMRAYEESKSKSTFLANMSHEIRTPMNAIIGMAELLLRRDLPAEALAEVQDIKQAGNNLISIINDILDFSKIEAGKLEIVPVKYLLASLVNDTVNIIRMRLAEKPIRFYTNIDGNIPNGLIGDEVRMRQILLNILSNAVKYSERGHISLCIVLHKRAEEQVWLEITISDTGKGIKPEDQAKLFGEFVQVDSKRNRGIEGTGLGLAITRRLCNAMGGSISVESEYGRGSAFKVIIPQGVDSKAPFAIVENPKQKKVLVYEGRSVYSKSVCWSLDNMKVPHTLVTNQDDFAEAVRREEWFYVFSGYGLYDKIKPVMEQPDAAFPGGKKPHLSLMVEWGTETYIPNVRFLSLPVQSLSIANILNGKADAKGYAESSSVIRFTLPRARILVVDDIATNLKVAEGLLAPYKPVVDSCLNGFQAIELVKHNDYDAVFMDHMMPEMDGIEATEAIRKLDGDRFKTIPIIALTANAVIGMREMFIEKGFNDFLAKPIDVSKLDEILDRWIGKEKRNEKIAPGSAEGSPSAHHFSFFIPGVDMAQGIAMTGGTEAGYKQVLALFAQDVGERMPLLQTMPAEDTLLAFVTQVHALKSASASLGAAEIAAQAAAIEAAGKAGDLAFIQKNLNGFAKLLADLIQDIDAALNIRHEGGAETDISEYIPVFRELEAALESKSAHKIDRLLDGLHQITLDAKTKEMLERISNQVLMTEFESAIKTIQEVVSRV